MRGRQAADQQCAGGENATRPFAVGHRNGLFADTSLGAKASATCYSLIETAKANGLEPYEYLRHVLTHIAAAETVEQIEALLPWHVRLADSLDDPNRDKSGTA